MAKFSNALAASAAVLAVTAAGAVTYAQMGHGSGHGRMGHMGMGPMGGLSMDHGGMMGQRGDAGARLETLKSDLAIRPEQAATWDAYAKLVTETAAERRRVHDNVDRDAVHKMQPSERQAFRESMMKQRGEEADRIKVAAETLMAELDDQQKSRARQLLPGLASNTQGGGHGMRHGGGHQGGQH